MSYQLTTYDVQGTISTKYFNQDYDVEKVETKFNFEVNIMPDWTYGVNLSLILMIQKQSFTELSDDSRDIFEFQADGKAIDQREKNIVRNSTPPDSNDVRFSLDRWIPEDELNRMNEMKVVPGFRVKWHYSNPELNSLRVYYLDWWTSTPVIELRR